jgi:hypothetical protein
MPLPDGSGRGRIPLTLSGSSTEGAEFRITERVVD